MATRAMATVMVTVTTWAMATVMRVVGNKEGNINAGSKSNGDGN